MTTVRQLSRPRAAGIFAAGTTAMVMLALLTPASRLPAQQPDQPTHWLHAGVMPPGAIGSQRLLRGGPLSGYVQPVKVFASSGVLLTTSTLEGYAQSEHGSLLTGLQVGAVYTFAVSNVPNYPEAEVYATVEVIDRLHPPCGKELKFPVPVQLTDEELRLAANNSFVTRVIYVEDPRLALPLDDRTFDNNGGQQWFEARPGDDPLVTADMLGRPIAILRIGSRRPTVPVLPVQVFQYEEAPAEGGANEQTAAAGEAP